MTGRKEGRRWLTQKKVIERKMSQRLVSGKTSPGPTSKKNVNYRSLVLINICSRSIFIGESGCSFVTSLWETLN